jgi:hypothetical protein
MTTHYYYDTKTEIPFKTEKELDLNLEELTRLIKITNEEYHAYLAKMINDCDKDAL